MNDFMPAFSSTFGPFPPPPVEVVTYWNCRMYLIAGMSFDPSLPVGIVVYCSRRMYLIAGMSFDHFLVFSVKSNLKSTSNLEST
ncbi:hypothetical protein C2G38_2196928 [Gigaspora rosea]|uniref:Uncharacterized protein n=1 Tax=Gigaspora rosea TaxID=44941 RepID=A0A397UWN9_9GLOM|nr:hypothetical protein C2G38_2196928 [Gigaspora rosea]